MHSDGAASPDRGDAHPHAGLDETAVVVVGPGGTVTAWGIGAGRLLGYAAGDVVGRPAARLLVDDLPEAVRAGCARTTEWKAPLVLRHAHEHPVRTIVQGMPLLGAAGETRWCLILDGPVPDSSDLGNQPGRELLRAQGLDQLPLPVALFDCRGRLVATNAISERLVGRAEQQVLGLPIGEMEPGRVLPGLEGLDRVVEQVLRTGMSVSHELYMPFPGDSREHAWTALFSPLKDHAGRVEGVSAMALDTTEQYQARQRLEVLDKASMRIGTTLDLDRTAEELAEVAIDSFADFAAVDLLDAVLSGEDSGPAASGSPVFRRVAQHSVLEGCPESVISLGGRHTYHEQSPPGQALASGRAMRHPVDEELRMSWAAGVPERARRMRAYGVHSTMVVPLRARGTTLGVALFARHRTPDPFDDGDQLLAEQLAARAAVCVDNARRYTRERSNSLALQRSLLPQEAPRQTAVEVASRYLPAEPRAGVGGDWYDVIPLSGTRVALVVGDVVGHGIQASATMGWLRMAVRTLADVDVAPDELLTQLDDLVLRLDRDEETGNSHSNSGEIGASCLYAVYDPISGHCAMARAGHPAPALVAPDGAVHVLDLPAGPPLGLGRLPFESAEFDLPQGSVLALYTNGLIQSVDHDVDAGLALLRDVLSRTALSLEERCDAALRVLLPDRPTDDVALLLASTRLMDAEHHVSWDLPADPAVVSAARRRVCDWLASWELEELSFTTELVVSELVTNAIGYGGSPIRLRLIRDDDCLICEVSDGSSTAPHLRRARVFDEGGRGLLLVAQLTDRWGTRYVPEGKTIWAEQALTRPS